MSWQDLQPDEQIIQSLTSCVGHYPEDWLSNPEWKRAHLEVLDRVCRNPKPYPETFSGKGIVISTSAKSGYSSGKVLKHGYFPGCWNLIHELRRLGCDLPITITHLGFPELDTRLTKVLEDLGVSILDIRWHDWFHSHMRILSGWESKIYSIIHAPYEEVLFLDSDNLPLMDPTYLFNTLEYQKTGAMFWPDLPPHSRKEWLPIEVWESVGLPYRTDYVDFESGQLLINKRKCWDAVQATYCINEHSDYWYKLVFGDKSTFFLGWNKTQTPYAMPSRPAGWNGACIIQHDMAGYPLFQHGVQCKASLDGYPKPEAISSLHYCNHHLKELNKIWDGNLWHYIKDAGFTNSANEYMYHRENCGSRILELKPDGTIGKGNAGLEQLWCPVTPGHIVVYNGQQGPTLVVKKTGDGFQGQWLSHEAFRCSLIPLLTL